MPFHLLVHQAERPAVSVNVGFVQQLAELELRMRGSCSLDPQEYAVQELWSMVRAGFLENHSGHAITEEHCRLAVHTCPVDASGLIGAMSWLESADLRETEQPSQTQEELLQAAGATAVEAGPEVGTAVLPSS